MSGDSIATIGVTVVGFIGVFWRYSTSFGRIRKQIENSIKSLMALRESNSLLMGALTEQNVLTAAQVKLVMDPFEQFAGGALSDMLKEIKPKGNPISREELNKIEDYLADMEEGKEFSPADARNFYEIAKRILEEDPDNGTRQHLVELAAYIVGRTREEDPVATT